MTEAEIIRESWRWHFHDLLRAGQALPEGATITEFHGDDEDFDQWARDLEEGVEEQQKIEEAGTGAWEEIDG